VTVTPLADAACAERFGGKAAALAAALRAGLPVPDGVALDIDTADRFARDPALAARGLAGLAAAAWPWAVRSSAIDEDGARASFAGQHLTRLGVRGAAALVDAVAAVHASASSPAAAAYRARRRLPAAPRMAIILQRLVAAEVAGVLFTRHPVSGDDEIFIEASWGLGEAVVSSAVTPDRVRLTRSGQLLECAIGDKEIQLRWRGEAVAECDTPASERARPCLSAAHQAALVDLAARVDRLWPGPHDIEFAFAATDLFLLQRRPLTAGRR
jgi:pyruvate,water dikinase